MWWTHDKQNKTSGSGVLRTIGMSLTGGLTAIILLSVFGGWQAGDRWLTQFAEAMRNRQPDPQVTVNPPILQQIRNASELTTAVFTMQAVVPTSQDASLGGFVVGTTKLLYIAQGEVQAGVDLSKLTDANVQHEGDRIRIQLPAPEVLNSKIDVNRSGVYDYNRGFLNLGPDAAPQLQILAQQTGLKKIVAAACADGLLQRASDRAKLVVSQLLSTSGYKQVTIEIPPVSPKTCQPASGPTQPLP
jgi:hypothetical protein